MTRVGRSCGVRVLIALAAAALMLATAGAAQAAAPWWGSTVEVLPTHLQPGGEGTIIVNAYNDGDVPANGSATPVKITETLPTGLKALSISGQNKNGSELVCPHVEPPPNPVTCSFGGTLNPYEVMSISVRVKVEEPAGTATALTNHVTIEGGGGAASSHDSPVTVSETPAAFGIKSYELSPANEDGTPATAAGTHPFQLTTTLVMNETSLRRPIELPKDLNFALPPGLIGNPQAASKCNMTDFSAIVSEANLCAASSAVGVATVVAYEPIAGFAIKTVPVFNLVPARGEPARLGFEVLGRIPVVIDTSVRSGRDYGVNVSVKNATQTAGLLSSQVTLWGVPADERHNGARGWECVAGGAFHNQVGRACPASTTLPQTPFLRLPSSCAADPALEPVTSAMEANSWTQPGSFLGTEYAWMGTSGEPLGFTSCGAVPFAPTLDMTPEQHSAATPTGVSVSVKVPQSGLLEAGGLGEADVRDSTVSLPPGVELSPSAANGLQACSEAQIGFEQINPGTGMAEFNTSPPGCPDASKIGTVRIKTPLLENELEGSVYLAAQEANPFGSLVAIYLVAEDPVSGVLVKLAGEGQLNESTLQVTTSFRNTPQVPFEELQLELFGGPRASVTTPALCGQYSGSGSFTPWSSASPVAVSTPAEHFEVNTGVGGGGCPASLPFTPGFSAQTTNPQAGAFTGFNLELTRPDGDQALGGLTMHLPPGIAALLSSVTLCNDAQAAAGACPAASEVGHATSVSGLGPEPFTVTGGRVYITGPYGGAPFGLEIITPAKAGPFDLGNVIVRSKLLIDPNNASVTIVSDPLPTQLKGIPLQLKRELVTVDRPGFQFNPTSCNPTSITGVVSGAGGAQVPVGTPFQVGGCSALPFGPVLTASTAGQGSRPNGTNLNVKITSAGLGQANIAKVVLQLPKELPTRQSTIRLACPEANFNANPASCDEGSVIGRATVHTPVLRSPLVGPAYLVSHGGAEFPDVEFVLQGEGVKLVIDGKTNIKSGITYSRFETAPDAPFTSFETELPAGPHSALGVYVPESQNYNVCKTKLEMPTTIIAQTGAMIQQTTKIAPTGCSGVLPFTKHKTRAQLLAQALKKCRSTFKHSRTKRAKCERAARRKYAAKKAGTKKAGTRKPAHKIHHHGSH